jgi:hypothetical protein
VRVEPEQDQRPEDDGEDRGENSPHGVEVLEVVVRRRDDHADDEIDDADRRNAHGAVIPRAPKRETAS